MFLSEIIGKSLGTVVGASAPMGALYRAAVGELNLTDVISCNPAEIPDVNVTSGTVNITSPGICGDVNDDGKVNMADVMTLWYDIADYLESGEWVIGCC